MLILADMDGVLADFELGVHTAMIDGGHAAIPLERRHTFRAAEQYETEYSTGAVVARIVNSPGFYANLPVIADAVDGLAQLEAAGHQVSICTSPLRTNPTCASEKLAWVAEHLGYDWVPRTIITSDKTIVRGDILIDDKPHVSGAHTPTWRHVLFSAPYNQMMSGTTLRSWADAGRYFQLEQTTDA